MLATHTRPGPIWLTVHNPPQLCAKKEAQRSWAGTFVDVRKLAVPCRSGNVSDRIRIRYPALGCCPGKRPFSASDPEWPDSGAYRVTQLPMSMGTMITVKTHGHAQVRSTRILQDYVCHGTSAREREMKTHDWRWSKDQLRRVT